MSERIQVIKARDGDGDGFVHDGTPQMRPATAAERVKSRLRYKGATLTSRRPSRDVEDMALEDFDDTANFSVGHDIEFGEPEMYPSMEVSIPEAKAVRGVGGRWINSGMNPVRKLINAHEEIEKRHPGWVAQTARSWEKNDVSWDKAVPVSPQDIVGTAAANDLISNAYFAAQLASVMEVLDRAPESTVWRGMAVTDDDYDKLVPGARWHESMATGTGRRGLAEAFAFNAYSTARGNNPVLFRLKARNIPIAIDAGPESDIDPLLASSDERLIRGDFTIESVTGPDRYGLVRVEAVQD